MKRRFNFSSLKMSSKIHTKEMICCIIVIVVGCLTTFSNSTAISASSRSNTASNNNNNNHNNNHHNNHNKANFNGNGILRDDDASQDIGFAIPASVESTVKSHKKQTSGGNLNGFNANEANGNDAYSTKNRNAFAENGDNDNDDNDDNDDVDDGNDFVSIEVDDQLSLKDQMRMFTEQMTKRFQHELKAAIQRTTKDHVKADFQAQLEQLR